ncbi:MAG: ATP-binding cassette domain-containing protein [Treponema sp.]|nr:ATP-binding cassette domain-containing protein [Treponema sp.]
MSSNYTVELRGIGKTYPGRTEKANSNISLDLREGEILCIAGENGAGKTTLMKILGGLEMPDSGEIRVNGSTVFIDSPIAARRLGIGMVHQHFMLFPEYTAAENIFLGTEPRKWGLFFDGEKAKTEAARVIKSHGFSIAPDGLVKYLSIGEMQQVEICRLLCQNAGIIILDEPTSVLTDHETTALFNTLRTLAAAGKSIFLITHKLHEIKSISDRVAVLRHGELAGILITKEADEFAISKLMIGSDTDILRTAVMPKKPEKKNTSIVNSKQVIVFNNVTVLRRGQQRPLLDNVSFSVRSGEILGFAGVGGNGLGVLEAVLGGFLHPAAGIITHNGRDISRMNNRRLRNRGLAYVPADRQKVGIALTAEVDENIIINRRNEFSHKGFLDKKAIRKFTDGLISRYNIAANGQNPAVTLSGGNLQKLILAREIEQFRDYFVFSEPTWGLDIAACSFVRAEIATLREKGAAIILISTNLDEILSLADKIIVMYRGRAAAEFVNDIETETFSLREKIGNCMQGLF